MPKGGFKFFDTRIFIRKLLVSHKVKTLCEDAHPAEKKLAVNMIKAKILSVSYKKKSGGNK